MSATLQSFLATLAKTPDAPLLFQSDGIPIQPNYHVTEVKLAHVRSLDCGSVVSEWDETIVQLLDSPASDGDSHMSASKFSRIAGAGVQLLEGAANGKLFFEFTPRNGPLRKLAVQAIAETDGGWTISLGSTRAVCKPAVRQSAKNAEKASGCCAPVAATSDLADEGDESGAPARACCSSQTT